MKPLTESDMVLLEQLLASARGEVLSEVTYVYPRYWVETGENASPLVNEVAMDLFLGFASGKHLLISWATGLIAGLALSASERPADNLVRVDASAAWRRILGTRVQAVQADWHAGESDHPRTVWSIRLSFETGALVSVFLGELRNGVPDYQPDSLLVFLSEIEAFNYKKGMSKYWA